VERLAEAASRTARAAIEKPLFVFGLPRTGTTLTINLLHADPARRSLLRWEAFDSVPRPRPRNCTPVRAMKRRRRPSKWR